MDFDYNAGQRTLRDEARRFLGAVCPLRRVRAVLDDPSLHYDAELWSQLADQGWLGAAIPEAYGGLGLSHVELGAIAEEIGAALAPVPFGSTLYLLAEGLMIGGSEAQRSARLPAIARGEVRGCAALFEGAGDLSEARISTTFSAGRLSGIKRPVVDGMIADTALVLARGDEGLRLFLVDLDQPAVTRTHLEAVDGSCNLARIEFHAAKAEPLQGANLWRDLLDRAAVMFGFEQIGGADRCLRMATDYVKERQAFGGPVGRFQAVKHKLADLYTANELARSHVYHGAWAMTDPGAAHLPAVAAAARVAACDAYWIASKEALHLHGAIGTTWEHDCHLYYRRAHHLSLALGSPQWWKDCLFKELARLSSSPVFLQGEH